MGDFELLGLVEGLRVLFAEFHAAWFLGVATICYLVIQVFRGKAGFNIPFITKWFEKLPKEAKTYIILGTFGLAGAFTSIGDGPVTFWTIMNGFLVGVVAGMGTIGTRSAAKQGIEGIKALKAKMQKAKSTKAKSKK